MCWPSACCPASAARSTFSTKQYGEDYTLASLTAGRGARFTACFSAPILSASSRSRAGRRCRCCRASGRRNSTISSSRWRSCARPDPGRHGPSLSPPPAGAGEGRSIPVRCTRDEVLGKTHGRAALSGAGDADRHRRRRLFSGRGRQAAPRHGDLQARRHDRQFPRTSSSTAWSRKATTAISPSAASGRSKVSANTASPKATPRASRSSSTPRPG